MSVVIEELSPAELALWKAFPRGEQVDLRTGDGHFDDPAHASLWGPERHLRAEVVVALLLGAIEAEPGELAAVRLIGARITGPLGLEHADVTVPLEITDCSFDEAPRLYWARMRSMRLVGCHLPGLVASGTRVEGDLWLQRSRMSDRLCLDGAHITGLLHLSGAHLVNPEGEALLGDRLAVDANIYCDQGFTAVGEVRLPGARIGGQLIFRGATLRNPTGSALYASRLDVGANVFCDGGFSATGAVRLRGARVGGYLSLVGAVLNNPGRTALSAEDLAVETDVYCSEGFHAQGSVSFAGARIGAKLDFSGGLLTGGGGTALNCQRLQAAEVLLHPSAPIEGLVDYSYASIGRLRDDPRTWPAGLQLDGLAYEALDPPLRAAERLNWLRRDTDGYQPQPYEKLAQTYRSIGLDTESRSVLLAKQRDRRAVQATPSKTWGLIQDVTVGYGYRPFRAATWLLALLALGTVVFSLRRPPVLDDGQHPHFNAFFYTLDLLLPIGSLGQEIVFSPVGVYQWVANLLVAAGLVLGLTVAAGVTRVLSRE
jgi:hypothetical protein